MNKPKMDRNEGGGYCRQFLKRSSTAVVPCLSSWCATKLMSIKDWTIAVQGLLNLIRYLRYEMK